MMAQYNVKSSRLVAITFFCLKSSAKVCVFPFLTLIFRHHGLEPFYAGAIRALAALCAVIVVPLLVYCFKVHRQRQSIITASIFLSIVGFLAMIVIPPVPNAELTHMHLCKNFSNSIDNEGNNFNVTIQSMVSTASNPSTTAVGLPANNTLTSGVSSGTFSVTVGFQNSSKIKDFKVPVVVTKPEPLPTPISHKGNTSQDTTIIDTVTTTQQQSLPDTTTFYTNGSEVPADKNSSNVFLTVRPSSTSSPEKPPYPQPPSVYNNNSKPVPLIKTSDINLNRNKRHAPLSKSALHSNSEYYSVLQYTTIISILISVILAESMMSLIDTLSDDSYYEFLDEIDYTEKYGDHNVGAMAASMISVLALSAAVSQTNCQFLLSMDHMYIFILAFGALMGASVLLVFFFPSPEKISKTPDFSKICKNLKMTFKDNRVILVSVTLYILGALFAFEQSFLLWYLEETDNWIFFLGLVVAAGIFFNIPTYLFHKKIINKVTVDGCFVLGAFGSCLRFFLYAFITPSWMIVAFQVFYPLSSVLLWKACDIFVDQVSNPGMDRYTLTTLRFLYWGLGFAGGCFLGGAGYQYIGSYYSFLIAALISGCWGALYYICHKCLPGWQKKVYSRLLLDDRTSNTLFSDSEDEQELFDMGKKYGGTMRDFM